MRKGALLPVILAAICVLALAACGGGNSGNGGTGGNNGGGAASTTGTSNTPTISMAASSFSGSTNVTITAGQSVVFNDPASTGGSHVLVTGTHGAFTAASGAPTEFASSSGIAFNPGDSKTIVFPNAGTFKITCLIHPSMQATITVNS